MNLKVWMLQQLLLPLMVLLRVVPLLQLPFSTMRLLLLQDEILGGNEVRLRISFSCNCFILIASRCYNSAVQMFMSVCSTVRFLCTWQYSIHRDVMSCIISNYVVSWRCMHACISAHQVSHTKTRELIGWMDSGYKSYFVEFQAC